MGEAPSYGIATGNRFAMVDIGDDIEDPAEFYNLIEQSNAAKKDEKKKKKEKKPEKKKEEEKKPEKKGSSWSHQFRIYMLVDGVRMLSLPHALKILNVQTFRYP